MSKPELTQRNGTAPAVAPRAIPGYEGLQRYLDLFSADHPEYDKNVVVMMRFREDLHYRDIFGVLPVEW